ncbi:WD repeat-containing protein [Paragonimus westermani]|uniref:WD repeat-containing protein n=1 Tax=Paragonimus westermani TaxID=34504 RepID=A0A8T0DWN1_9TREM|nr:WD repeat-containing protein [Paragonimus westermani]
MLYKGSWYEEMINNRNKSVVSDMKWDTEGTRICIVYEDGGVIVGSVDGNRIWGKEVNCGNLLLVEWSPDNSIILFGLINGEIHIYDYAGNFLSKLSIYCLTNIHGAVRLVGMHWYHGDKGLVEPNCPTLAICYDIGRCQLMRSQLDTDPILLDTGIEITCSAWNENGSLLAVAGLQKGIASLQSTSGKSAERDVNVVQFYSAFGEHLRSICLPGKNLAACAWEGNGSLRLALAVDSLIYFANLRPDYKWAYCNTANTVIYAFTRAGSQETCVAFWNTKNNQTRVRSVFHLSHICAAEDYACLVCRNEPAGSGCTLTLCNALGVSMDSKRIPMEPTHVLMTGQQVIAVNKGVIYAWQFFNPKHLTGMRSALTNIRHRDGSERICHVDLKPVTETTTANSEGSSLPTGTGCLDWSVLKKSTPNDPICAIAVSGRRHLFVARVSGQVQRYRLPDLWLEVSIQTIDTRPYRIQSNCDATLLAIIDESGIMTMQSLLDDGASESAVSSADREKQISDFIRKDVWNVKFADDHPDMFAIMEKTRMFIFDGFQAEPAVQTSCYICSFNELEVLGVLLDELIALADQPSKDCLLRVPIQIFRECEMMLEKEGPSKTLELIEANPHPRLRRLLAEKSLAKQDLDFAELGFVYCQNYAGIQFVKRLRNIPSKLIRKAEIESFFGNIDEAEQLLLNSDRSDLAIELRRRLGHWFRVAQLTKDSGALVKDADLAEVWNVIGDHFADQMLWDKAASYYRQGGDLTKYAECLYQKEDYNGLERLVEEVPDGHALLPELAMRFASIGLAQQAVYALVKCDRIKEAIDVCAELNCWQMALDLVNQQSGGRKDSGDAQTRQFQLQEQKIDRLLAQSVTRLLEQGRRIQAVELYKRAGKFLAAAQLLFQEAQELSRNGKATVLQLKKMYVLIGLLIEQYYEQNKLHASTKAKMSNCPEGVHQASSALAGLLLEEKERTDTRNATFGTHESTGGVPPKLDESVNGNDLVWDQSFADRERRTLISNKGPDKDTADVPHRQPQSAPPLHGNWEISRLIDQPWRGAEAYHYLILAQRQLYAGSLDQALRTAQLLRDYEDILEVKVIYSLIATCAIAARAFGTCSKAFIKLESLTDLTMEEQTGYQQLALNVFTLYPPTNEHQTPEANEMDSLLESEGKIPICIVTGQPVTDYQFWMCPTCKHSAYEQEITRIRNCPLCHFPVQ